MKKDITYKEKKERTFFKYIEKCVRGNIPIFQYTKALRKSIQKVILNTQHNGDFKAVEKNAWNTVSLLSAKNVVRDIVENDEFLVKEIFLAYGNKKDNLHINEYLLKRLVKEIVLNKKSLLQNKSYNNGKEEFKEWLTSAVVDKYDILSYLDVSIKNLDEDTLKIYNSLHSHILSISSPKFGAFSNLEFINHNLVETISTKGFLEINEIVSRLLTSCANSQIIKDESFSLRRFAEFFDMIYIRFKSDDLLLRMRIIDVWNVMKEYQKTSYIQKLFETLFYGIGKATKSAITQQNAFIIKIFLLMEWGSKDLDYFTQIVLPFLKGRIKNNDPAEMNILSQSIPWGKTTNDILAL